ncbi:MAG: NADH-quinone oxidoreductase subunit NuoB [Fibrobacteres bacterium]|jgi:NADH-quinone oxidoreductase B subunit/NADH/F420H2 dehydrogenase subunit C|nr:NADH-quinone oxidoreductase subunit NuoB [Fibrobacterota bacterium]
MGMTPEAQSEGVMLNAVDYVVGWARANSLWPLVFGTSCCAIEMMATGASHNDWARFGLEVARATPRQADLIVLAGTIVEKMGTRLVTLYEQMPGPKFVIAMGACTISGGPFYYDSYSVVKGADRVIPVDVYIPGCPPRPEALLFGIMKLQELIKAGGRKAGAVPNPVNKATFVDMWSETAKAWEEKEKAKQEAMKEAQERFKKENPDYKGVVIKRVAAPKFDEVARAARPERGLPATEIWSLIESRFPGASVFGLPAPVVPKPAPAAPVAPQPASPTPDPAKADAPAGVSASAETPAPAPAAAPAPAPVLTIPERLAAQGPEWVLDVAVKREDYLPLIRFLKEEDRLGLDFLIELTAVDWKDRFDVVAHLLSMGKGHKVFVRCALPHDEHPEIDSLTGLFAGADWHEREAYDFFGIRFAGHPDLRRLFLEDDFPGHPLRKDFEDPTRVVKRAY